MNDINKTNLNPIFVIGYKRSGTTLLRLVLNSHPNIAIPPESEYFQKIPLLFNLEKTILKKDSKKTAKLLSQINRSDFGLNLTEKSYNEILDDILPCKTKELIASLYLHWARLHDKSDARWGDKKPQHWKFVYKLKKLYPESQFIHIMRDPRDVYASIEEHFPEQVIGRSLLPPHIITAWQYKLANKEMLRQKEQLKDKRYFFLIYEDFVINPEKKSKKICRFLNISYNKSMLNFQKSAQKLTIQGATPNEGPHMHTTKRVNTSQIKRFEKSNYPDSVISDIEYICRDFSKIFNWKNKKIISKRRQIILSTICLCLDITWQIRMLIDKSRREI